MSGRGWKGLASNTGPFFALLSPASPPNTNSNSRWWKNTSGHVPAVLFGSGLLSIFPVPQFYSGVLSPLQKLCDFSCFVTK